MWVFPPLITLIYSFFDHHPFIFSLVSTWFLWAFSDLLGQKVEITVLEYTSNTEYQQRQRRKDYYDPISIFSLIHSSLSELVAFLLHFARVLTNTSLNYHRLVIFATYGAIIWCPLTHLWLLLLTRVIASKENLLHTIIKVALDQLVYSPFVIFLCFFVIGFVERRDASLVLKNIRSVHWHTLKYSWCYWPFVQLISFGVVHANYRILFLNSCAIPWTVFMAMQAHKHQSSATSGQTAHSAYSKQITHFQTDEMETDDEFDHLEAQPEALSIHDQKHKYHTKLNEQDTPKASTGMQLDSSTTNSTTTSSHPPSSHASDGDAVTTPLALSVSCSPPVSPSMSPQDDFEIVSPQGQNTNKGALPTFSALYDKQENTSLP